MPSLAAFLVIIVAVVLAGIGGSSAAGSSGPVWTWPLQPLPRVVRYFEAPSSPYGPGHRGVDLAGSQAQPVLAMGAGTVTFAGSVAGRGVVVVDHGHLTSTYQPVTSAVTVGALVSAGQPIGFLQLPHSHCAPAACLHLGVRRAETYLDPLTLLGARPVRLKPLGGLDDGAGQPPHRHLLRLPTGDGARGGVAAAGAATAAAAAAGARLGLALDQARA